MSFLSRSTQQHPHMICPACSPKVFCYTSFSDTHTRTRTTLHQEHKTEDPDVTTNTNLSRVPHAHEPTRKQTVTAPAQAEQHCSVRGVVTRATRSRRDAKAMRHQASTRCSALYSSRFSSESEHVLCFSKKCFFQIPARSPPGTSFIGSFVVEYPLICQSLPERVCVASKSAAGEQTRAAQAAAQTTQQQ